MSTKTFEKTYLAVINLVSHSQTAFSVFICGSGKTKKRSGIGLAMPDLTT